MLGIRPPSLCAYENGHSEPSVATLNWYCRYFDVSANWLLGMEQTEGIKVQEDVKEEELIMETKEPVVLDAGKYFTAEDMYKLRKLLDILG